MKKLFLENEDEEILQIDRSKKRVVLKPGKKEKISEYNKDDIPNIENIEQEQEFNDFHISRKINKTKIIFKELEELFKSNEYSINNIRVNSGLDRSRKCKRTRFIQTNNCI